MPRESEDALRRRSSIPDKSTRAGGVHGHRDGVQRNALRQSLKLPESPLYFRSVDSR
jgi:hypothetical protein